MGESLALKRSVWGTASSHARNGGAMKAYIITSGGIFGLLTIAHLLRVALENRHLAAEPVFILITLASATLCIWAFSLLRRTNR